MAAVRLDRVLANLGYGSRREVKVIIASGRVRVGDEVVRNEAAPVRDPGTVLVDGAPLDHPNGLTVLLNKPLGHVCSHDEREGPRAYDLLPWRWLQRNPRLESVGRLDRDTTGVILFTDDHQALHRLTSPRHHVPKTYRAVVDGALRSDTDEVFASGTLLLDGEKTPCLPAVAFLQVDQHTYDLTIVEGRYHQVRRMFAAAGGRVEELTRLAFGPITLDGLAVGDHRVLTSDEVAALREASA